MSRENGNFMQSFLSLSRLQVSLSLSLSHTVVARRLFSYYIFRLICIFWYAPSLLHQRMREAPTQWVWESGGGGTPPLSPTFPSAPPFLSSLWTPTPTPPSSVFARVCFIKKSGANFWEEEGDLRFFSHFCVSWISSSSLPHSSLPYPHHPTPLCTSPPLPPTPPIPHAQTPLNFCLPPNFHFIIFGFFICAPAVDEMKIFTAYYLALKRVAIRH